MRRGRQKLNEIAERFNAFHEEYADWEIEVANFLLKPSYTNVRAKDTTAYIVQFTQTLRDQVHRVDAAIATVVHSLEGRGAGLKDQRNWLYTMTALFLSALAFSGVDLLDVLHFLAPVGSDLLQTLKTVLARF